MADKGHEWTDKEIDKLERRLKKVYKEAENDLKDKLSNALESIKDAPNIYEEYKELKKVGKLDEAERKLKEYQRVMKSATYKKDFYENHLKAISNDITHLNERALAYANDKVPDVLKHNYNFVGGEASKHIQGYSFHMADEHTVKQMTKKLPKKKVKVTKDHSYNNKLINSQLLQGIIQGEDIPTIAQRMSNVMNTEWKASVRNARTMMTSAENLGRMESYEQMQEDGVILKKVWLATPDERTRQSHLELDGVELDIDEPFETINGNQLMYPADPDGEPEEVFNCRCTLVTHVIGFRTKDGVKTIDYERPMSEHDKAIEAERESRGPIDIEEPAGEELSLVEQIKEYQRLVEENGLKEEYVMNAGKAVSEELKPYYDEMKAKEDILAKNYEDAKNKFAENSTPENEKKYMDAFLEKRQFEKTLQEQNAEKLKDLLSQFRSMGAQDVNLKKHLNYSRSPVRKFMEWAYDKYPTEWVKKSADYSELSVKKVQRGFYSHWTDTIALSGFDDDDYKETAIHELGHRFERIFPSILNQEKLFYERRTKGEELVHLGYGYGMKERTRKDNFVDKYMGKDYGGDAYELVSMGFQYAYTAPTQLAKDPDMQQWILGLLTLAK